MAKYLVQLALLMMLSIRTQGVSVARTVAEGERRRCFT